MTHIDVCPDCGGYWETCDCEPLDVCKECGKHPIISEGRVGEKTEEVTVLCGNKRCLTRAGVTRKTRIQAIMDWNLTYGTKIHQPMTPHPYHCVKCGHQLYEKGLGVLGCEKCDEEYIPTSDPGYEKDFPGKQMMQVCWIEDKITELKS